MTLIEEIVEERNMREAVDAVINNKGAAGIDHMSTDELYIHFEKNKDAIIDAILAKKYKPLPVRRVYIPKSNGKMRPLGIPTVCDRAVQQAMAQVLVKLYEPIFSDCSYGFRPQRDCEKAVARCLEYLNEGYEWVVDFDIEKFFDTVNHDKLISIVREHVKDSATLHLIRSFLSAGVMEDGEINETKEGVPQGGCVSPVLANIYLDKLDKELEARGLRFVRYADDFDIFVKSEMSANRVMESVSSWLERKLMLKVSATKTKVVRPSKSNFLGFTFWKGTEGWQCRPTEKAKANLCSKVKILLKRKSASASGLWQTFTKLNEEIHGWIVYYRIGSMKAYLRDDFGPWLRHKVRVVILKQWKKYSTIQRNLRRLRDMFKMTTISDEDIYSASFSRLGLFRRCGMRTINTLLSPKVLATPKPNYFDKKKSRPGLVDPYLYYLGLKKNAFM